jgi:hypothetical protein
MDIVELRAPEMLSDLCVGILCDVVSALLLLLSVPYTSHFRGLISTFYFSEQERAQEGLLFPNVKLR